MENVVWGEENRILRIESMNKWWTVYMYAIYACTSMSHHIQPKTFTHKRTSYLKWTWNNICLAHAASCKPTKKEANQIIHPKCQKRWRTVTGKNHSNVIHAVTYSLTFLCYWSDIPMREIYTSFILFDKLIEANLYYIYLCGWKQYKHFIWKR